MTSNGTIEDGKIVIPFSFLVPLLRARLAAVELAAEAAAHGSRAAVVSLQMRQLRRRPKALDHVSRSRSRFKLVGRRGQAAGLLNHSANPVDKPHKPAQP